MIEGLSRSSEARIQAYLQDKRVAMRYPCVSRIPGRVALGTFERVCALMTEEQFQFQLEIVNNDYFLRVTPVELVH